jgi:uncharacterized delta-60 repeat protein
MGETGAGAAALMIQPDGKLVAAGDGGGQRPGLALVRYNADGTLDKSFGTNGRVVEHFAEGMSDASELLIQSDGKLVVAGTVTEGVRSVDDFLAMLMSGRLDIRTTFAVARFLPDGSPDETFGSDGDVATRVGDSAGAESLALERNGGLIVGGYTDDFARTGRGRSALVRYDSAGKLDRNFGSRGRAIPTGGRAARIEDAAGIVARRDGSIVSAGSADAGRGSFGLLSLRPNGRPNRGFGASGTVLTRFGKASVDAYALAEQPDGRLVAAGSALLKTDLDLEPFDRPLIQEPFAIARYKANGALDTRFGKRGRVLTAFPSVKAQASANAVAIQPDGRIVGAGSARGEFVLARYLP